MAPHRIISHLRELADVHLQYYIVLELAALYTTPGIHEGITPGSEDPDARVRWRSRMREALRKLTGTEKRRRRTFNQ